VSFARRDSLLDLSRKGAKAQRKSFRNAAALCVFGLHKKYSNRAKALCEKGFFSRKGAKKTPLKTRQRFAPLREKIFSA